jgi:hypothetical protein
MIFCFFFSFFFFFLFLFFREVALQQKSFGGALLSGRFIIGFFFYICPLAASTEMDNAEPTRENAGSMSLDPAEPWKLRGL